MKPRTPEKFIEVWQQSESCKDAAQTLEMSPKAAASRAWTYRRKGIDLKKFPQGGTKLQSKHLRALAKATLKGK